MNIPLCENRNEFANSIVNPLPQSRPWESKFDFVEHQHLPRLLSLTDPGGEERTRQGLHREESYQMSYQTRDLL